MILANGCNITKSEKFKGVWILSVPTVYGLLETLFENLESEGKSTLKLFKNKSLAIHITNQKISVDIFTVGNSQNIIMEHDIYLIC